MLPPRGTLNLALSVTGTGAQTGHVESCPDINGPGCASMPVPDEWHDLKLFFGELRLHAEYGITVVALGRSALVAARRARRLSARGRGDAHADHAAVWPGPPPSDRDAGRPQRSVAERARRQGARALGVRVPPRAHASRRLDGAEPVRAGAGGQGARAHSVRHRHRRSLRPASSCVAASAASRSRAGCSPRRRSIRIRIATRRAVSFWPAPTSRAICGCRAGGSCWARWSTTSNPSAGTA